MRKNYLLCMLLFCLFSGKLMAQDTIPNAGFEHWVSKGTIPFSYEDPANWVTTDTLIDVSMGAISEVTVAKSSTVKAKGAFSMMLITKKLANNPNPATIPDPLPGVAIAGKNFGRLIRANKYTPGFAVKKRPRKMLGSYRYITGTVPDTGFVLLRASKNVSADSNFVLAAGAYPFVKTPGTQFVNFAFQLGYNDSLVPPDSLSLMIFSGDPNKKLHDGSTLYVDDLKIYYTDGTTSGIEELLSSTTTSVYPNPTSDAIHVMLSPEENLVYAAEIIDIMGRRMKTVSLHSGENFIDVSALPQGLYFWRLLDAKHNEINAGKVQIIR